MPIGFCILNFQLLQHIADLIEEIAKHMLSRRRGLVA